MYYIDVAAPQLGQVKTSYMASGNEGQLKRTVSAKNRALKCGRLRFQSKSQMRSSQTGRARLRADARTELRDAVKTVRDKGSWNWERGDVSEEAAELLKELKPDQSPANKGMFRVNYFFFGDLLNAALTLLEEGHGIVPPNPDYKNSPSSKVKIMCGPIYIQSPCAERGSNNNVISINIADIPISLNVFTAWFTKTVIRRMKPNWLLRNFINEIIGELLPPALGEGCVEGAGRQLIRVNSNVINVRGDGTNPPFSKGDNVSVKDISEKMQALPDISSGIKTTHDYLLLYAGGFSPTWLQGDKNKDKERGIYHFQIGAYRGILKSMKFEKSDAPFMGEAKVTGDNNIANDLGGGAVYNFTAELLGNALFVPGAYVFIDSRAMGLGHPAADGTSGKDHSIANRLRLGGYYNVSNVESTLARGNFTTTIKGIWESSGGQGEKAPPERGSESDLENLSPERRAKVKAGLARVGAKEID